MDTAAANRVPVVVIQHTAKSDTSPVSQKGAQLNAQPGRAKKHVPVSCVLAIMRFFYASFFLLLLLQPTTSFSASEICPQVSDYMCLVNNSIRVYREDPEQWWKIYDYTSTKALKCTNIKDVTLFLRLWLGVTDGEMSEGLEGDSLEILTKNKQCFFDGVLGMSLKDRENFIARFIVIDDDETAYVDALKEAMKNPRYKSIAIKMLNLAEGR